ncbi:titin homolog [Drosophila gunungcola]|uniref:titin homolog n=1 Tax=Drosophila gunungcola TaxID=103775 RepID=UPI0022E526C1|nr:titin homolog [Drosophila gunungcola]
MVKRFKASSSLGASDGGSVRSGNCKDSDQVYCVLLHVVEAINFVSRDGSEREQIVMNAALNTVDFEVEGTQSAETIIFNSNCIWECDLAGIKRIKTDHRPVKITFSACRGGGAERKTIGSLLLPVRGLPVLATTGSHNGANLKMFWHKLICISSEFRSHKPEVLLMLAIIKKSILHTKDFDHLMQFTEQKTPPTPPLQSPGHSITASMLQSQANVYVQSLVQLGLLQVGNDPLIDCDIIEVVLQLKQLKNVNRLVKTLDEGKGTGSVILVFDFVGNVTNIELKLNESDSYILNDVLGLRFKTSLRSMRLYFQRIFYLPINMYMNGSAIATYRMDFGNLLPPDNYFSEKRKYTHNGSFSFNRLAKRDSAREPKSPLMEYSFSVDVKTLLSGQGQEEPESTSSVASGVIRELPKDRKDPEVMSLSHDTASVASLNVGAELSVSEGSCRSTSPKEDGPDSDASVDHRKPENRRKKFTRLQCEEDSGESEDELRLGKTFSALVVREDLNFSNVEKAVVRKPKNIENLQGDDFETASCDDKKLTKVVEEETKSQRKNNIEPTTKESSSSPKKLKIKSHKSNEFLRESFKLKIKTPRNNISTSEENDFENFGELTSLELFELEEKRQAKEAELLSFRMQRIKESSPMPMESKVRKTQIKDTEVLRNGSNRSCIDEATAESPKQSAPKEKVCNKNVKKLSKTQLNEVSLTHISPSELKRQMVYEKQTDSKVFSENSYEQSDEDLGYGQVLPEKPNFSREKLTKKPKSQNLKTKRSLNDVQSVGKTKSQFLASEELEDFEEMSTSTQETRSSKTSKGNLGLRARWVEVNKKQTQVLDETEKFLQETCRAELDEVLYEDQLAFGLAKPLKLKKKVGKSMEDNVKSINYENSYLEEIAICQSQEDLVKKKKRTMPIHQMEIESSEEYISLSEGILRSAEMIYSETEHRDVRVTFAQPKGGRVKKKMRADEDDVIQDNTSLSEANLQSTEKISAEFEQRDAQVKSKKREFTSSQEFISESNLKYTELTNQTAQPQNVRVLKKKKLKKMLVKEDSQIQDNESQKEEAVRPVKKKVLRKKSSVISDNIEHTKNEHPPEEIPDVKTKKIIRKKPKPLVHNPLVEEITKNQTEVCQNFQKKTTTRKKFKDLSTSEECYEFEKPTNMSDTVEQKIKFWRRQQIEIFEQELARKELHYKTQLEEMENQEARIHKLSKDETHLDETFISKIKNVSCVDYEAKFQELEEHIALLKSEMEDQVRLFEDRSVELRQENLQLCTEKTALKIRIAAMEQQIEDLKDQGSGGGDLKQVLGELRSQNRRYNMLACEKERYKKRWRRSARRVHTLKLAMYERNMEREHCIKVEPIDLRQILTQDAMEFEREYGQFRQNGQSSRYSLGSMSGSGDYSTPNKSCILANNNI